MESKLEQENRQRHYLKNGAMRRVPNVLAHHLVVLVITPPFLSFQ